MAAETPFSVWSEGPQTLVVVITVCLVMGLSVLLLTGVWRDVAQIWQPERTNPPASSNPPSTEISPAGARPSEPDERFTEKHADAHNDLAELVREDPKAAADLLTHWVRKAG